MTALPRGSVTFREVVLEAVSQPDPASSLDALLRGCVQISGASTGRLFRLELEVSGYTVAAKFGRSDPHPGIGVDILEPVAARPTELLEKSIASRRVIRIPHVRGNSMSRWHAADSTSRLILPIVRASTCLGAIDLDSQKPDAFSGEVQEQVRALSAVALALLEQEASFHLLTHLQEPIDYSKSIEDFLHAALQLASKASGMPFIAVRESQGDEGLRCAALWGFGTDPDKRNWDFERIDDHPTFARALKGETVVERDMRAPGLSKLRERSEVAGVHSFVATPIRVGTEIFGVLSFGAPCVYDYSAVEVAGFESIANGLGVAITNNRNFRLLQENSFKYGQVAFQVQVTAVDVAQAARHEARGIIDNAHSVMAILTTLARTPSRENLAKVAENIVKADGLLDRVEQSLDKIRAATQPLARELEHVSIRTLWEEAIAFVRGRLDQERIDIRIEGPDARIEAYPDFLRHAFLNLLLNSIDAFRDKSAAKGGRSIRITLDPGSDRVQHVKIRYLDNAAGIDRSKLKVPDDVDSTLPLQELIFEPGVTSRPRGSGYGLYLVRKIVDDHDGSIDLVSHRSGVVFDITLSKKQELD